MKRLKSWLQLDISSLLRRKQRRLGLAKQVKMLQLMTNLFASGFHLGEIVDFLARSKLTERDFVTRMKAGLLAGKNLAEILADLKFSQNVVTQVALVDYHGNLGQTLGLVEQYLRQILTVKKKLLSLATYPVILLLFLLGITLGLKNYLLPQLEDGPNFASLVINHLPTIFLSMAAAVLLLSGGLYLSLRRRSALANFQRLATLPLLGGFIRLYLTAYFAREWGNLLSQGLELRQVFQIMREQPSRIFREVGEAMLCALNDGVDFHAAVASFSFFKSELALMVEYGELKAQLGTELVVYAGECWTQFFEKIERALQWIQPLVFLFVALMIVLLYAAMLLPIYSNMTMMN